MHSQLSAVWTLARSNDPCRAKTRLAVSLLPCSYEAQTGKALSVIISSKTERTSSDKPQLLPTATMGINDINTNNHYIPIQYKYTIYIMFVIIASAVAWDTDAEGLHGLLPSFTMVTADALGGKVPKAYDIHRSYYSKPNTLTTAHIQDLLSQLGSGA